MNHIDISIVEEIFLQPASFKKLHDICWAPPLRVLVIETSGNSVLHAVADIDYLRGNVVGWGMKIKISNAMSRKPYSSTSPTDWREYLQY